MFVIGASHFLAQRFYQAVPHLLLAIQDDPTFPLPYRWLAAYYAHMRLLAEARETIDRLRSVTSVLMTSEDYLRRQVDRDLYTSGLRLALGETDKSAHYQEHRRRLRRSARGGPAHT